MYTLMSPAPFDTSPQVYWTLVRCHLDGAAADTLITMNADKSTALELFTESGKRVPVFTTPIFAPYLWWAVSGHQILTASTLEYQIEFRDAAGQLVRVLKGPGGPFEVTPVIRSKWLADDFIDTPYGSLFKQLDESPDMESLKTMPFAQQRQSIMGLAVDPLRRIWALSSTEDPGINRLDIFTSDGDYLGHLGHMDIPTTFLKDGTPVYSTFDSDNVAIFLIMSIPR